MAVTPEQAAMAAARLDAIEAELGQIASWLTQNDSDQAAIALECAVRDILAAARLVERRARRYPAGWLGNGSGHLKTGP